MIFLTPVPESFQVWVSAAEKLSLDIYVDDGNRKTPALEGLEGESRMTEQGSPAHYTRFF